EIVFAFLQVRHAAVIEWLGVSWIELDRLIKVLDGAVVIQRCGIGVATIVIGNSQSGRRRDPVLVDERRASSNASFKRRAVHAVAGLDILQVVVARLRLL